MKDQRDNDAQRLVGGDFSGIQPYIYQITSKYAKRNLKGRSFYLQLLSDSIVRYLLSRLKLGEDNVIYNAGGCFYITMPDTEECVGRLRSSIEHIEETMLQYHGTSLYVAIDSVVLERGALGDTFEKLFARRDAAKQHRYSALLKKQKSTFLQPICENYNIVDCVTGAPFAMGEQAERFFKDDDQDVADAYKKAIRSILSKAEECREKECVLRVGHASGWRFMTGAWAENQFDDATWRQLQDASRPHNRNYEQYRFPKTRRVFLKGDDGIGVLGFVKLKIVE